MAEFPTRDTARVIRCYLNVFLYTYQDRLLKRSMGLMVAEISGVLALRCNLVFFFVYFYIPVHGDLQMFGGNNLH